MLRLHHVCIECQFVALRQHSPLHLQQLRVLQQLRAADCVFGHWHQPHCTMP
jgi:predicted phosphodiesterase